MERANKIAVVTGCNRGAGSGIALELLGAGYTVIGLNRTEAGFQSPNYTDVLCDVADLKSILSAVERVIKILADEGDTGLGLLVCNAGIRRFSPIEDMVIEDWQDSLNTNLSGVFYVIQGLIGEVKKAHGDVVIIGSHSEKYTFESGAAYCSTKGALKELAECLMHETRYDGVRTSYLSLGSIKNRDHGIDEDWKLTPRDVGEAVLSVVELPKNIMIPYLDVRPAMPLKSEQSGIERLQYV